MTGERDEPADEGAGDGSGAFRLRVVRGPVVGEPPAESPPVRLRREFKGLTVADMYREEIVKKLPGQVRSALHHLERGDLAAAERALPGHFAAVYAGPGHGHRRRRRWSWFAFVGALAVLAGVLLSEWLCA
ncbi:MAG TPA: hypothetical protein ENI87_11865 [bacterium]|nr:hypothetical protein [bacterium]